MAVNRVKIEVASSWHTISTTEDPAYVEELARELDEQVRKLLNKNDSLSINDALILCSLQFLLDKRQAEQSADRLRQQFSGYMEEIKQIKDGTIAKQKENEDLRREVLELRAEVQHMQKNTKKAAQQPG